MNEKRVIIVKRSWKNQPVPEHGLFTKIKARKQRTCHWPSCKKRIMPGEFYFRRFPPWHYKYGDYSYCISCGLDDEKFADFAN